MLGGGGGGIFPVLGGLCFLTGDDGSFGDPDRAGGFLILVDVVSIDGASYSYSPRCATCFRLAIFTFPGIWPLGRPLGTKIWTFFELGFITVWFLEYKNYVILFISNESILPFGIRIIILFLKEHQGFKVCTAIYLTIQRVPRGMTSISMLENA